MAHRSRKGCHTCKRRHKKCDETKPICERCTNGGFHCDGYEIRLTWGEEDAASQHGIILNPVRQKRARPAEQSSVTDILMEDASFGATFDSVQQYSFSQWELDIISHEPLYNSPTSEDATEKRLMDAFTAHGYLALTGRGGGENLLVSEIVPMTEYCLPLRNVCMAYQASLEGDKQLTGTYLERGLFGYYSSLFEHDELMKDSTLATGVLLCSVSISSAYIWTPLLRGLYWILETRGLLGDGQRPKLSAHLTEVVGLLDQDCFILGRTGEPMHLWRDHVASRADGGLEQSSSMPYSLINIASRLDEPGSEADLAAWPGAYSTEFALIHLWEAFRSAAILHSRLLHYDNAPNTNYSLSNEMLVMKVLASIQAVRDVRKDDCSSHLVDHVVYPLFIASIISKPETSERRLVETSWQLLLQGAERQKNQICYDIMLEVWKRLELQSTTSPWTIANDFARELNIEFYLS